MADPESALAIAAELLLQAPPGELNDVYADLVTLVAPLLPGGQAQLETALRPALSQYAAEQLTVVELPSAKAEAGTKMLLTPASRLETGTAAAAAERGEEGGERHVAPAAQSTFVWDAVHATASNLAPLSPAPDPETEDLRAALEQLLAVYTTNHYAQGASAVFALPDPAYPPVQEEASSAASAEPTTSGGTVSDTDETDAEEVAETAGETAQAATEALPEDSVETATDELTATVTTTATEDGQTGPDESGDAPPPPAGEDSAIKEAQESAAPDALGDDDQPEPAAATKEPLPARPSRLFALYLVGNKYNPSNYWTGRWRSTYTLDWAKGSLKGVAQVNIHYYEQGNVQLSTTLQSQTTLSAEPSGPAVLAAVKASESAFQRQLGETYAGLSDTSFKHLRRALPKTRSKIDWDKAGSYRLGQQIGGGGGGGGGGAAECGDRVE